MSEYTREAGVRTLERQIGAVCRSVAVKVAEGKVDVKADEEADDVVPRSVIAASDVESVLGSPVYRSTIRSRLGRPGVSLGLAWTSVGGEVLLVEATKMAGEGGRLTLTGQLGDVMKESATIALNWIRAKWTEVRDS